MIERLTQWIDGFAFRRVLVIGDAMLDGYLEGTCARICPEAPAPVVQVCRSVSAAGGAANVAVNVRSLGADVVLLAVAGDDPEADELAAILCDSGVSRKQLLRVKGRRTLAKRRIAAAGQIVCRLDQGHTTAVDEETEARLVRRLSDAWSDCDAVIISDYGYGMLTANLIGTIAEFQRRLPRVLVCDSKRLAAFRDAAITSVKPNYGETLRLLGLEHEPCGDRASRFSAFGARILDRTGARIAAVTLDSEGAILFERDRPPYRTYAEARPQSAACGAGDTYVAAMALALACGAETPATAELAAAAAAVVVDKPRTAACTAFELTQRLAGGGKILPLAELTSRLQVERERGRRIALTNGCFDILHRGHVAYLARAKSLADRLIVGVNTDAGIRRLKGPERPINTLDDRLHVLAALSSVDYLVPFDEDTPHELIRALRPDVFVKGGDYTRERLPEASLVEELGGDVRILSFLNDRSTTGLIEKIRTVERLEPARSGR